MTLFSDRYRERLAQQILQALRQGPQSPYRLIDAQDGSLPEFLEVWQTLQRHGLLRLEDGKASLTPQGEAVAAKWQPTQGLRCPHCAGTGYRLLPFHQEVLARYRALIRQRPPATEAFDQGYIDPEGVVRRLAFIHERGDLNGTRIFIVGDDDLLSIAAALTGLPEHITVVDIDQRIVDFINRVAREHHLPIEAAVYDVQQAFPAHWQGHFDLFVTDPVETLPGLELFLSRGVSTLKGIGCAGYFGLTTLEASRKKWLAIQKMIHRMGLVITDIRRQFNVYPDEGETNFFRYQEKLPIVQKLGLQVDYNWYTSALYRIEAVETPRPVVTGPRIIDEQVYKDEESWATPK